MQKTHCCFLSPVINTEKNSCLLLLCTCLVLILLCCTATTNEVTHSALNGTMCGEEDTVKTNGTILIDAEWITSKNRSKTKIKVNRLEHEKYKFKPIVIGESKAIRLMNAKNVEYYQRKLESPAAILWLLSIGGRGKRPIHMNYTMKRLYEKAYKMNIQLEIKETHLFDLVVSQDGLEQLIYNGKPIEKMPDAVLSRLGAKIDYFGLAVVRHLERMDVLVLNNHKALETSKDKLHTLQDLAAHNMPIPKTMIAKFPVDTQSIQREFKFPLILKHSSGTQGKGVMLIENLQHLSGISHMIDVSKPMVFQEYISKSSGRDIRVIVVGGKAVGAMMRIAKSGFKANFHQGGIVKKIRLSPAVEWLAIEATRLIGLEVAGVDILIDKDTYKICEINSSPGFMGFEMATEVDVPFHILDFVKLRTGVWKMKRKKAKTPVVIPVEEEHAKIEIQADGSQEYQSIASVAGIKDVE
jgi:gamma-F420-2:alpha-L-glutamate ligase